MPAALAALARTHGVELVRIDTRVRRQRDVARQRIDGRAQGAARGDGVGHRHAADVRRLDALHARAPLRPAGDGGARRLARPRRPHARRRAGAAVGHLHRDRRRWPAPPQGLDQRRRHADHDRRGVAVGGARQRRPAVDVDRAEGRQARGRSADRRQARDKDRRRARRRRAPSTSRRRSSRSASGRTAPPARCCASRSIPSTGCRRAPTARSRRWSKGRASSRR